MQISSNCGNRLIVEFGTGFTAKSLTGANAIIDFSRGTLPVQIELVSVVDWAARFAGETLALPSPRDLAGDDWCLRYDPRADCLMVYLCPDSGQLTPFRNREVPATLSVDYGGCLCGVSVELQPSEVAAVMNRLGQLF